MKSDGSSNIATIDPNLYGNLTTVTKEPYYFQGVTPDNYVYIGKDFKNRNVYARIYKVERDDSLVLYHKYVNYSTPADLEKLLNLNENNAKVYDVDDNEFYKRVEAQDLCNSIKGCINSRKDGNSFYFDIQGITEPLNIYNGALSNELKYVTYLDYDDNYYTRLYYLKPCWKIINGSGSEVDPFNINNTCN